ncbi:hypothetical protein AZZ81_005031 [Klebsiella aerogenes]|nr:hypothetical protein AZZ81_005031 [Klebsiella aerogenes]
MSIEQEIIDYIYTHHSHKKYCFFGERPEAVSYTHLDVYKRQSVRSPSLM